ncbi:hypothetical protein [Bacillus cereus]|uniref:hypothetical protein n=1 Tax=Bacillus cereus TaxID=1396 RepID=UPI003D2F1C46
MQKNELEQKLLQEGIPEDLYSLKGELLFFQIKVFYPQNKKTLNTLCVKGLSLLI